jgi:hypothetical protein
MRMFIAGGATAGVVSVSWAAAVVLRAHANDHDPPLRLIHSPGVRANPRFATPLPPIESSPPANRDLEMWAPAMSISLARPIFR